MILLQSLLAAALPFLLTAPSLVTARPHPDGFYNALARREEVAIEPHVSTTHDDSGTRAVHVDINLDNISDDREIDIDFHIHLGPHLSTQATIDPPSNYDVNAAQPPSDTTEDESNNGNTNKNPPPPQVLSPGTHPNDDLSNRDNLLLNSTTVLYYEAPKGDGEVSFALVTVQSFVLPAVNLDRTTHISTISCSLYSMTIVFSDQQAYALAAENWSNYPEGFIIILYHSECGSGYQNGDRSYIFVKSILVDSSKLTIVCTISDAPFIEVIHPDDPVTVDVGHYKPDDGTSGTVVVTPTPSNGTTTTSTPSNPTPTPTTSVTPGSQDDEDMWEWDIRRDQKIGYVSLESIIDQLLPGIEGDDEGDYEVDSGTLPSLPRRKRELLSRRGLGSWLKNAVKKTVGTVSGAVNAAKSVVQAAVNIAKTATTTIAGAAALAYEVVKDPLGPHTVSPLKAALSKEVATTKDVATPDWGQQTQIYTATNTGGTLNIYCVNCQAHVKLDLTSKITFSLKSGITEAKIIFNGDMGATLGIGIAGTYVGGWKSEPKQLVSVPLTPLTIPSVLSVGPQFALYSGTAFEVKAEGSMLGSITVSWPAAHATVDLVNFKSGSAISGWDNPQIDRTFTAKGSLEVSGTFYLDLSLEVGVDVLNGKWKKAIKLVDEPYVTISAGISGSVESNNGQTTGTIGDEECGGLKVGVDLGNKVFISVPGLDNIDLWSGKFNAWGTCIGGASAPPTATTTITDTDNQDNNVVNGENQTDNQGTAENQDGTKNPDTEQQGENSNPQADRKARKRAVVRDWLRRNRHRKRIEEVPDANDQNEEIENKSDAQGSPTPSDSATPSATSTDSAAATPSSTQRPEEGDDYDMGSYGYELISTDDGSMSLIWADNGNLYAIPENSIADVTDSYSDWQFFAAENGVIYGDADGKVLHAYVDTLQDYQVSRLRLANDTTMPATSVLITLETVDYDGEDGTATPFLLAFDSAQNYYFPVACVYKGSYTKLFLVKDPVNGPATLMREDLRELVTGQEIQECGLLYWSSY